MPAPPRPALTWESAPPRLVAVLVALVVLAAFAPATAAQSLFADVVARRPGDVITVVLAERTQAQRRSTSDEQAQAGLGGSASVGGSLAGQFGADTQYFSDAAARSGSAQSDLLSGTVSVVVTGVDDAGNLVVEGERKMNVNGSGHRLRVAGLVRPDDVRAGNVVFSYQIANAEVDYRQDGLRNRFFKPSFFAKAAAIVLVVAAVVFGASQIGGDVAAEVAP
ncbi:flagellar basal body L-ring protein FlgH [Rubrivirga litoralis]|uniref:Flagellar basal body L-ring protein FlgH n=1 Tax=Rubrivirga litoralis TaxID=3075598 RepID=A0ABU3BR47_9BACT|nr:flagellar basal body L-ring protein FlgH [Rubrivirga sp. F394]MDT0631771.1 flagellar basal body L-ring protein FlgH [Rubrivirga sp. F394]